MARSLQGKTVAILATDGFEESELVGPRDAVREAGAEVHVVSLRGGEIQGMQHDEKGGTVTVDRTVGEVSPDDYDALLLPGGVKNPDVLRQDETAVAFVKAMADAMKPIGAICHGPWLLVEAGVVRGRTVTSYPSLRTDIVNAGGTWVDEEVHTDQGLVTSRKPDDLPAFNAKVVEEIAEGRHGARRAAQVEADRASAESFPASDPPAGSVEETTASL
ncbi:MAG: Intracellular protease [uncultured Thermoleophilia bacterium]|uniref:Intracellular protease n=1 Tax=uncultured Thermoleophilia bacterium TaxID=1497501 RepID=A0A6J4TK16_9ACTN|nr:MAG: Intracellular protease [uncultured Thermoleophilia bacterium]